MTRQEQGRPGRDALVNLPSLQPLPTTAERAADAIRENIFEGRFQPGSALPETALSQALQVSRNTVREAFRTLISEHLLTYEAHKGVTVRSLTAEDVRDIYGLRRMLETAAIDALISGPATLDEAALHAPVALGDDARSRGDWMAVGTANLRFHSTLVELHQSPRTNEFFRHLMTEMRLGFLALDDPATFHAPYLARNRELCDLLVAGRFADARSALDNYLKEAMYQVSEAVASQ